MGGWAMIRIVGGVVDWEWSSDLRILRISAIRSCWD